MLKQHPIFSQFCGFVGSKREGEIVDWLGGKCRAIWVNSSSPAIEHYAPPPPPVDNEYLEWVDLLDAVATARDRFVMMELGAGFGKWGTRGALAARQRGIKDIHVVFVEAEPIHADWVREALTLNGLSDIRCDVIEAAIGYGRDSIPFAVGGMNFDATNWYGQFAPRWDVNIPTGTLYQGRQVFRDTAGYEAIFVPTTSVQKVAPEGPIDLIDMDLQEAELGVFRNEIDWINGNVRRLHIETHLPEIETEIRDTLRAAGWAPRWDLSEGTTLTEFGPIFMDPRTGLQGWTNPRLEHSPVLMNRL